MPFTWDRGSSTNVASVPDRGESNSQPAAEQPATRPVSRAARMLALAHYVERLVEEGSVRSYADAARQLGVTRARMSQVLNLLNLPPRVQEGLLLGDLQLSERRIRALVAGAEWVQVAAFASNLNQRSASCNSDLVALVCCYNLAQARVDPHALKANRARV